MKITRRELLKRVGLLALAAPLVRIFDGAVEVEEEAVEIDDMLAIGNRIAITNSLGELWVSDDLGATWTQEVIVSSDWNWQWSSGTS